MNTTSISNSEIFKFLTCIFLGILFSLIIFNFPASYILGVSAAVLFIVAAISKSVVSILAFVVILSSIIFEEALPILSMGIGSFHLTDIFLLSLIFLIFFVFITDKYFTFVVTPLDKPLLLFYSAAVISVFISLQYFNTDFNMVMRSFRYVTYYLIFFLVTNMVREKKQIKFLTQGLLGIAFAVSITMFIQAILGRQVQLMPGRVETARVLGISYSATRILPPGQTLIFIIFLVSICLIVFSKKPILKSVYFYLVLILGVAILLTYNRSYWVSIFFALSVLMLLTARKNSKRVAAMFLIALIVLGVSGYIFLSAGDKTRDFVLSVSDRLASLFAGERLFHSSTLEHRRVENQYAWDQIKAHPILGIGLGNSYRPGGAWADDQGVYIHNGYLWILLKMGLIGFIPFVWFYGGFLIRGYRNWNKIENHFFKAAVCGFTLSGTGILLASIINPMFMQWYSIVVIAVMIGLTEVILRLNEQELQDTYE